MAPPDDAEVNGDGDELLEWLWDLPERYDVGIDDDSLGSGPVPAVPSVRKYLRKPGEAEPAAGETPADPTPPPVRIPSASPFWIPSQPSTPTWGPSPNPTRYDDDRPTLAIDPVDPYAGEGNEPALATILAADRRPSRFNVKDIASAVAVFLVVAIGVGVGYTLLRDTGSHKNRVAIGFTSTTQGTTNNGQGIVPPLTDATSTTSSTEPDTTTTISVPAVGVGATTTTTRCAKTLAAFLPDDPRSVMQVGTTTTTTMPPTTTTTTTTTIPADTTTTSTSVVTITLPPTTTATTVATTVPRTTTTLKKTTTTLCH